MHSNLIKLIYLSLFLFTDYSFYFFFTKENDLSPFVKLFKKKQLSSSTDCTSDEGQTMDRQMCSGN